LYGYCKFEKDRSYVKRELGRLPLLKSLRGDERFKEMAQIPEELDEEEWEYGVVKKGSSVKSGEKVAELKKKEKDESALPPVAAPKDWMIIQTKHYMLLSNSLRDRLKELAYRLELVQFEYRKFFGAKAESKEVYTVKMFKDRASFQQYAKEHGVEGFAAAYFSFEDKELVLYDLFTVGMGQKTFNILYHEAAHQFIWHYLGEDVPIWFHEAVAQYFEGAAYSSGRFKVGSVDYEKTQVVHNALMRQEKLALSEMLGMSRGEFYSGNVSLNYATAYYFLLYLLNFDASTKSLLSEFVSMLRSKGDSQWAYDNTFGKQDLAKLQQSFEQYILKGK
jgi:hypothetical protein